MEAFATFPCFCYFHRAPQKNLMRNDPVGIGMPWKQLHNETCAYHDHEVALTVTGHVLQMHLEQECLYCVSMPLAMRLWRSIGGSEPAHQCTGHIMVQHCPRLLTVFPTPGLFLRQHCSAHTCTSTCASLPCFSHSSATCLCAKCSILPTCQQASAIC